MDETARPPSRAITFRRVEGLPKLSWVATLDPAGGPVTVFHGRAVECHGSWMAEGVWDGPFASGDFHRSKNFFGSGLAIQGDSVVLAASTALVDRLIYCLDHGRVHASNSLALLLAYTGASLDPSHDYRPEGYAILKGLGQYERRFAVSHQTIDCFYQIYEENIVVREGRIDTERRTGEPRFGTFWEYLAYLESTIAGIGRNLHDPARHTRLSAYGTLSSGYDSPMVAALVRNIGVNRCFTSRRSNSAIPAWISRQAAIDDGTPIAERLGIAPLYLDASPRRITPDELCFLAVTCADPELVFHSMAEHIKHSDTAAVVFTGFHGDKVWDVHTDEPYLGPDVIRGDTSGLNLAEARLSSGFIHVAVPFIGARKIHRIVAISRSAEMAPWRLHTDYDRPIPRRVVEGAGVPRHLFGQRKKAVVQRYAYPVHPELRADFFRHIADAHGISAFSAYSRALFDKAVYPPYSLFRRICPSQAGKGPFRRIDFTYLMHLWAIRRLAADLRRTLSKAGVLADRETFTSPTAPAESSAAPR